MNTLDGVVFSWINMDWSSVLLDAIMPWISHLGDPAAVWFWIALLGLLVIRNFAGTTRTHQSNMQRSKMIKAVIYPCLYMTLIYGVNAGTYSGLKHLFHRSRPFVEQAVVLRVSSTTASNLRNDGSFPSGHASNAFMIATLFAAGLRRKRFFLYGLAAVVAISRIYLGVHYPSDVLVGSCFGLTITWFMLFLSPLNCRMPRKFLFISRA